MRFFEGLPGRAPIPYLFSQLQHFQTLLKEFVAKP